MASDAKLIRLRTNHTLALIGKQDVLRTRERTMERQAYARRELNRMRRANKRTPAGYDTAEREGIALIKQQLVLLGLEQQQLQADLARVRSTVFRTGVLVTSRRTALHNENIQREAERQLVVRKVGVEPQYLDNVRVSNSDKFGDRNVYFGGIDGPVGPGHGHYVLSSTGQVTYKRAPFDPHGVHNFQKVEGMIARPHEQSARYDHDPMSVDDGGVFYRRTGHDGMRLHVAQRFADNYHVSWDVTSRGMANVQWTNGNVPAGHPDRYCAPQDANL